MDAVVDLLAEVALLAVVHPPFSPLGLLLHSVPVLVDGHSDAVQGCTVRIEAVNMNLRGNKVD